MAVQPIRPDQVADTKAELAPDFVMQAWNQLIAEKFSGGRANFTQNELMRQIRRNQSLVTDGDTATRQQIIDNGWLDLEDAFRAQGWSVTYDKPGYCESYQANWTFKRSAS